MSGCAVGKAKIRPLVAVLEDEAQQASTLCAKLEATGHLKCVSVNSYEAFTGLVEGTQIDVASIDYRLGQYDKGREVLELLVEKQRDAARVVYTMYAGKRQEAVDAAADVFLAKQPNDEGYVEEILNATKLGVARRLATDIAARGGRVPPLQTIEDLSADTLESLRISAAETLFKCDLQSEEASEIRDAMAKMGWRRSLEIGRYARCSWREKLGVLATLAELNPNELAHALGMPSKVMEGLLAPDPAANDITMSQLQLIDQLLTIFSYILQIAQYQPDLIRFYWEERNMYEESLARPPWDAVGIRRYLEDEGAAGVTSAAIWIRSH